jgi:hypothetical protein
MFEKATRLKLKFNSNRGILTTEDLWDLSLQDLNKLAKTLNKEIKIQKEDDFLEDVSKEDEVTKLKFDLVLYILKTKKKEAQAIKDATAIKIEKEKILAILAKKQDDSLENMSEDELKEKLKNLG